MSGLYYIMDTGAYIGADALGQGDQQVNAEQKRAMFCLIGAVLAVVAFLILSPIVGPRAAVGAFGLLGLAGFGGFVREKEKPDERDAAIAGRATRIGAMASYGVFIMASMGIWHVRFLWQHQQEVSVHALPWVTYAGAATFFLARSVAVLVLYGRRVEADNG